MTSNENRRDRISDLQSKCGEFMEKLGALMTHEPQKEQTEDKIQSKLVEPHADFKQLGTDLRDTGRSALRARKDRIESFKRGTNYSLQGILRLPSSCNAYMPNSFMSRTQRRIEDRIRELCAKALATTDSDLEPPLRELSQLLRGTIQHMRTSATNLLVEGTPLPEPRRRANDNEV